MILNANCLVHVLKAPFVLTLFQAFTSFAFVRSLPHLKLLKYTPILLGGGGEGIDVRSMRYRQLSKHLNHHCKLIIRS